MCSCQQIWLPVLCLHFLSLLLLSDGATRVYYVGIRSGEWNYAPLGKNAITGQSIANDSVASSFLQPAKDRIGGIYRKSMYKQYSDSTYTLEISKPAWLGFLGPVIRGEVGDTIIVHLKNFASRPFTIHPHGVFYTKDSEGALYPDRSSGDHKADDAVPPGGNHTYTWTVPEAHGPTADDPACLTWIYHSHVNAPKDIASGLVGPLLICKQGTLKMLPSRRHDVDLDFFLMFSVVDENESWHLDENIASFCTEPDSVDKEDEEFRESNRMHAINGFIFGNLPEVTMCAGDRVSWHLFGMGNEIDVHTAFFHGQTLISRGHRSDVASLFPATFVAAEMVPHNIGKWLLTCEVSDHLQAGMEALYEVKRCSYQDSGPALKGKLRQYYIAAKEVRWNYGPSGLDPSTGKSLHEPNSFSQLFFKQNASQLGGTYWKAKYVEYTDGTFRVEKEQTEEGKHLGILGPVIKAEVGDTIQVTFANKASWPFSIQPHGGFYRKPREGAPYQDDLLKNGASIKPFGNFTYLWVLPPHVGPTASDPPCLTWMYSSAVDPTRDINSGLVGPLLICRPGTLNERNKQRGIDKEFYLLFGVFNENLSWYLNTNRKYLKYTLGKEELFEDHIFKESNRMHAINGFLFGNLPLLDTCKGDTISWHLLGFGSETDVHGVAFQGNTILMNGMRRDTTSLFPHTFATALMQPDNQGIFDVYCQTSNHYQNGMRGRYSVRQCGEEAYFPGRQYGTVRTFYIMAEEMEWDYAPDRSWESERHNSSGEERYGDIFLNHENGRLGSRYKKAVYREYTDGTFQTPKSRTDAEQHLGILGPFIWAEVGDVLNIVFRNNATQPYSIHAHGVLEKNHRDSKTAMPGEIVTYQWDVPERSGPGPNDSACLSWIYYSTVDRVKDLYSGLVGPLKVCRKGTLDSNGRRKGVSKEFALLFLVFDENQSWYLEENVKIYIQGDWNRSHQQDEEFMESNKMHAINGKVYANLPGLEMCEGDWVNWYLLGMGQEIDVHTVHFHAETFIYRNGKSYRADVVDLFPGTFEMVEMQVGNPGTWLLHCHVADHIHAGMETLFTILPRQDSEHCSYNVFKITAETSEEVTGDPSVEDPAEASEENISHDITLFGSRLDHGHVEAAIITLAVAGVVLFITASALLGVIFHLKRQKRLRRNKRSILDESFKLMRSQKHDL
ncbi:hephaestin isoform X2 [Pseudonaja textilis]|uniref:hephaestin isoform X2 n=1 Tax=Pseudonaja textilis TaxID=8673 RepID=UPI000EA839C2|nr:hephaestin isoform X2 [Pseudonaja textilis]